MIIYVAGELPKPPSVLWLVDYILGLMVGTAD